jgi:hypothetical protein
LPPSAEKNKPSMEQMVIQGRENRDKCTAFMFRVEVCGRWVIVL